jgi:hypothetical protein
MYLVNVVCGRVERLLCRAGHWSGGVLPSVVCLSDCETWAVRRPRLFRGCCALKKKLISDCNFQSWY